MHSQIKGVKRGSCVDSQCIALECDDVSVSSRPQRRSRKRVADTDSLALGTDAQRWRLLRHSLVLLRLHVCCNDILFFTVRGPALQMTRPLMQVDALYRSMSVAYSPHRFSMEVCLDPITIFWNASDRTPVGYEMGRNVPHDIARVRKSNRWVWVATGRSVTQQYDIFV